MIWSAIQNLRSRRYARRILNETLSGRREGLNDLEDFLLENYQPLRAPMVLISQVQRSGGTLLSQLFDGHSQIAAHPDELRIGHPNEEDWPPLDPRLGAEENFRILFAAKVSRKVRRGYSKGNRDGAVQRFFLIPRIQLALFKRMFDASAPASARDILDCYFSSYFNAWLNYVDGLQSKRWVSAFAPRIADNPLAVAGFFRDYPEGRLIQIVRDPSTWFPSARNHRTTRLSGKPADYVMERWAVSASSMIRNKAEFGDRVIIIKFEDLLSKTEATMRRLSSELGIDFEPTLTTPTYLGRTVWANSSFDVGSGGVIEAPLARKAMLSSEDAQLIERIAGAVYRNVRKLALDIAA